jgi:hypothetical protein
LAVEYVSRDHSRMPEHPRCAALLPSGERCRSVAATDSDVCAPHRELVSEVSEEALRKGRYPRRRQDSNLVRVVEGPTTKEHELPVRDGDEDGGITPSQVRPRLAAAAAANLSVLERVLLDAATGATREAWTTITCKHCERQGRYEVAIPDHRTRLDAVEKLLQQGLGRAREAEHGAVTQLPTSAVEVEKLSWRDLQQFAATFCLDDLLAVQRRGGEALLRERVAALSEGERRVLRDALAEAEA